MLLNIRPNTYGVYCTNYRATLSFDDMQNGGFEGERKDLTALITKLQKRGYLGGVVEATSPHEDMTIFIEPHAWKLEWESYQAFFDILAEYTDLLSPAELSDEQYVWKCGGHKTSNNGAIEVL